MSATPSDFQICAVALRKMVTRGYYCCTVVQECFKLLGKPMPHSVERYRLLHCMNWSDMPPGFAERILRDIVTHLYAGSPTIDLLNNVALLDDPEVAAARGVLLNKDDSPFWDKSQKMEELLARIDDKIDELVRLEIGAYNRKNWLQRLLGL